MKGSARFLVRVDVDVQNGFCAPEGGLYVPGAEAVVPVVAALNRDAEARGIWRIGSVDTHDYRSPELQRNGGPWPDHCLKGTWDWLKPPATLPERFRFIGVGPTDVAAAFDDGRAALYFEKDGYSFFENPNLPDALRWLEAQAGGRPLRFEVYGIATDYCVRAAAEGLRRAGFGVTVLEDAVTGVTADGHREALDALRALGCEVARARVETGTAR